MVHGIKLNLYTEHNLWGNNCNDQDMMDMIMSINCLF